MTCFVGCARSSRSRGSRPRRAEDSGRSSGNTPWQQTPQSRGFWAVTRYHDVVAVLRDPGLFSSWRGGALLADPPPEFLAKLREGMLNRDPPEHTALRGLVQQAFNPRRVADLER